MATKKTIRTDAATIAKMLADQNFACKHIQKEYINDFLHYFEKLNLIQRGIYADELFSDFCLHITSKNKKGICRLATYNPNKGLFRTWICTAMYNYCVDKLTKEIVTTEHYDDPDKIYLLGKIECVEDDSDEITYDYSAEYLTSVFNLIDNDKYRTILIDRIINKIDDTVIREKLGMSSSIYSTYKKRAVIECADILEECGMITEDQKEYLMESLTPNHRQEEPFMLGMLVPGMSFTVDTTPRSGNRDIDWIVRTLHSIIN